MTANPRRLIACDEETWRRFMEFGAAHGVSGYNNRVTVAATLRLLLEVAETTGWMYEATRIEPQSPAASSRGRR